MGLNEQELLLEASGPKFDPPLYVQRYNIVRDLLQSEDILKVCDFGCSDGKFTRFLKNLIHCREISLVDSHYSSLMQAENIARPLAFDFLIKRENSLQIKIYKGSVAEKDYRLKNYDAVTLIEVVEHLDEDVLEKVPEVIFDYIQPKVAIVTTPNREFNCLFSNKNNFRHWDHKFEWSREEFQIWANGIVTKYPLYEVNFEGVGYGPQGSEHLGACTQMAVFRKVNVAMEIKEPHHLANYELINSFIYPGKTSPDNT